jgi:acyl CoA:acetate/3-ketoacid CoA transferase
MASKLTIAEVFEIVEPGELDPEAIVTPGMYIDRIVRIPDEDVTSLKRRNEFADRIRQLAAFRAAVAKAQAGGQQ